MTPRERLFSHLRGEPVDRLPALPITMQYAGDRLGVKYRDYVLDHRVLVEAQIRAADHFGFDYVSCISDPAREAADCGADIEMFEDQPPAFVESRARLADKAALATLSIPDPRAPGRMRDRVEAAALFRTRVGDRLPIEGWIEGPCAEGADLRGINTLMVDFFDDPGFVHDLFAFVVQLELRFARAQVEAGADFIGIGDAAASLVGPEIYEEFVWPYEKQLVDGLHAMGIPVRLHICGDTRRILGGMGRLGCEIVDLDYPSPLAAGRAAMGPGQVLLGNLHPVALVLNGTPTATRDALAECHAQAGCRYIAGAGCEIPRGTPEVNVHAIVEYARAHRP